MFERLFRYERMAFFIFKYLILDIPFFYYANKEIKTLNREYLQNITAVFFSNKKNRLTAMCCCHVYTLGSSTFLQKKTKTKTKQNTKQNKYSSLWPLR